MQNDYELIYLTLQGDDRSFEELIQLYKPTMLKLISSSFQDYGLTLETKDDLMQELMITLYDALIRYQQYFKCSFHTFYFTCGLRRLKAILRKNYRPNHYANTSSVSLDICVQEDGDIYYYDMVEQKDVLANPEYKLNYDEAYRRYEDVLTTLSEKELQVFELYLRDATYEQGAKETNLSVKAFDNRIQKIKRKIKKSVYLDMN